jgi:hypothetical protein
LIAPARLSTAAASCITRGKLLIKCDIIIYLIG